MADKLTLHNLTPSRARLPARKRVGRGPGSGLGKTSGKGNKGHKARTGGQTNPGFEGGQMPMYRRLPKRGFTNPFKVVAQVVNLRQLKKVGGTDVSPETLYSAGLIGKVGSPGQTPCHRGRRAGVRGPRRGHFRVGAREDRGGRRDYRGVSVRTSRPQSSP